MHSAFPIVLAIAAVLALALLGAVIAYWRSTRIFRGYEALVADVRAIARALDGSETFRDGADLVVSGNHHGLPTMVRFSHGEHTPGLYVRMGAPASFSMSVAGRGTEQQEGRVLLKTGNEAFDLRFAVRTDYPSQTKMLLAGRDSIAAFADLCCSNRMFFATAVGALELSELVIPAPPVAQHILDHLQSMKRLVAILAEMPGAHAVKVQELQHERSSIAFRAAVALSLVLALAALGFEVRKILHPPAPAEAAPVVSDHLPAGVLPVDAALMLRVQNYRMARVDDFDPAAVNWLRNAGQAVTGRITGDFSGRGLNNDVGYVLVGSDGVRRLVLLANGENRYDANYPFIGIAARVPKGNVGAIEWVGKPPQEIDGDGLLITRKTDDLSSGLILFSSGNRIVTGVPVNYQAVRLD